MTVEATSGTRFGNQNVPTSIISPAVMPYTGPPAGTMKEKSEKQQQQQQQQQRDRTLSSQLPDVTRTGGKKKNRPDSFIRRYRVELAASSSSVFSTLVAFPLDSVKTRMQIHAYRGFLDCLQHTYRTEKLGGFFRGVTAPMASITLVRTVSFSLYQRSKLVYADWIKRHANNDILAHVNRPGTYPTFYSVACFGAAGATAGFCMTFLACPFELTKLSAQVSVLLTEKAGTNEKSRQVAMSYQNKGTLRTMMNIMKHRGPFGLYTGLRLHLLRDTLGTGIYFMVYESGKQLGTTFAGNSPNSNKLAVVAAGGLCGLVSWALIYPIDSAKSIYQRNALLHSRGERVEPAPRIQFFQRNMYRGLGVSMARSCAVNAIFFSSFEFIKKHIKDYDETYE